MKPIGIRSVRGSGFTLVELLVVVAVIGILTALLLPTVAKAKEAAYSAKCRSNLHQIGLALSMYVGDFHHYPGVVPSSRMPTVYWPDYLTPYCGSSTFPVGEECGRWSGR